MISCQSIMSCWTTWYQNDMLMLSRSIDQFTSGYYADWLYQGEDEGEDGTNFSKKEIRFRIWSAITSENKFKLCSSSVLPFLQNFRRHLGWGARFPGVICHLQFLEAKLTFCIWRTHYGSWNIIPTAKNSSQYNLKS